MFRQSLSLGSRKKGPNRLRAHTPVREYFFKKQHNLSKMLLPADFQVQF